MRIYKRAAQQAQLLLFQASEVTPPELPEIDPRPEMLCFRGQTFALVRHFFELSCQAGRLPSPLGRELFRSRVSHHAIPSFEEQVVFVRDVELCLAKLSEQHSEIITLVGLYDFTHDEVGEMLRCSKAWITQRFAEAIDSLSEILLEAGLLSEGHPDRRQHQVTNRSIPADAASFKKPPSSANLPSVHKPVRRASPREVAVCEPLLA
jgi:hypothetical protein